MTPSAFERLAGWSQRRHWLALALWAVVLVGITVASQAAGTGYRDDHTLPGTGSQQAAEALSETSQRQAGDSIRIVIHSDQGLQRPEMEQRAAAMLAEVRGLPHVVSATDPYESPAAAMSDDATIAFATVTLDESSTDIPANAVERIVEVAKDAESAELRVELGGDAVRGVEATGGGAAEGAGMLAALVILVFMFGSLLAASLPLITAVFAVGSTLGVIALLSNTVTIASYTPPLMALVGIGVGIDYALLVFSRYRTELLRGMDRTAAARRALNTAGRSVLFAGLTVIVALLGLFALGLGSLQGVALAIALTVLVTILAAMTLLPALLTLFGRRIERRVVRHADRMRHEPGDRWRRWSDLVQRRPWPPLLAALAALALLAVPALDMRLGFADAGTAPPETTSRQAYDLLAEGFGPGFNSPLMVVSEGDEQAAAAAQQALTGTQDVANVSPPQMLDSDLGLLFVVPTSAPQAAETTELVHRLRTDVLPPVAEATGATYSIGGSTAAAVDFSDAVSDRMPVFLLVVVGLSALLLMAIFRSLLVPLKAAVLNLLSIGASLGVVTLVFQEGWFGAQSGPIEAFVPVMIFAIVFGLSMDYEVFLVSRMHEEWRRTGQAEHAVREGLAMTGGVITAAAAIMIVVFGAFVLSPDRMLQQFGLGLAVAVFLDALIIRCLIVPAAMRLFGERAWWLPRSLDRWLPTVPLERHEVIEDPRESVIGSRG